MSSERTSRWVWVRGGGWFVIAVCVFASLGAAADVAGWPAVLGPGPRSNLVLLISLSSLVVWWGLALRSTRGLPVRTAASLAFAGAVVSGIAAAAVVLGTLGFLSMRSISWAFGALALDAPILALALLSWPGSPEPREGGRLGAGLDVTIVVVMTAVLFWDFLYRPAPGIPAPLTWIAWLSWLLVLMSVGVAALRGAGAEGGAAFRLLVASLLFTFAGNYVIAVFPTWPPRVVFVSSVIAVLLRLVAADTLRTAPITRAARMGTPPGGGVVWVAAAALGLLALHQRVAPLDGEPGLLLGLVSLASLLCLRGLVARRAPRYSG